MNAISAGLAVVVLITGGCSDGDDDSSANPPSIAVLEQSFREFQIAYDAGDGERAWEYLSRRCQDATTRDDFVRASADWAEFRGPQTITSVKAALSPTASPDLRATVTWTVAGDPADGGNESAWVAEDGAWHHDTC